LLQAFDCWRLRFEGFKQRQETVDDACIEASNVPSCSVPVAI
jgi:hypothetical protein